jgi:hypothetical protein
VSPLTRAGWRPVTPGPRRCRVHGHRRASPDRLDQPEEDAIRLAIRVMEKLLFDRRDLISVKEWEIPAILGGTDQ